MRSEDEMLHNIKVNLKAITAPAAGLAAALGDQALRVNEAFRRTLPIRLAPFCEGLNLHVDQILKGFGASAAGISAGGVEPEAEAPGADVIDDGPDPILVRCDGCEKRVMLAIVPGLGISARRNLGAKHHHEVFVGAIALLQALAGSTDAADIEAWVHRSLSVRTTLRHFFHGSPEVKTEGDDAEQRWSDADQHGVGATTVRQRRPEYTSDEFELDYVAGFRNLTLELLRHIGRRAEPCDCDLGSCRGWRMAHPDHSAATRAAARSDPPGDGVDPERHDDD